MQNFTRKMMNKHTIAFVLILLISALHTQAQRLTPDFLRTKSPWADSIFTKMTPEQRMGQLIMVTAYADQAANQKLILSQIENAQIGGILYLKTSPQQLAELTQTYQKASKIPLFIGLDGENGLSFRLSDSPIYPHKIALGAISNDSMLYQMGREIGQQCRMLGINLNFGPVADINSNIDNPVINYRSFGTDPKNVSRKSIMLAKGMQDERIIVSAKHFPGHGDTSLDSHFDLPVINHNYARIDSLELIPFRDIINAGINGIMTAHIALPKIDTSGVAATLSKIILQDILRDSLKFSGLIFSDAMNMKGVLHKATEPEAIVRALQAGVDVVEFVTDPAKAIEAIKLAIEKGELTQTQIDEKCLKVLRAKEWGQIHRAKPLPKKGREKLNQQQFALTRRKLVEQSLALVQNREQTIPLQRFDTLKAATIAIGESSEIQFQKRLSTYTRFDHFVLPKDASAQQLEELSNQLRNYNIIIAAVSGVNLSPSRGYGITDIQKQAVETIPLVAPTVTVFFCNPLAIPQFKGYEASRSILLAHASSWLEFDLAAQAIMGAINITGKAPISLSPQIPTGTGIRIENNRSLGFTTPAEVGIDSVKLFNRVDSLCTSAVLDRVFPGCQVLVAKNGKVILQKAYGFHTYENQTEVTNNHVYDWASVTKITGPTPLLMLLYEKKQINLDWPFSRFWIPFAESNKKDITLRQILAHQAGLRQGIPFHVNSMRPKQTLPYTIYHEGPTEKHTVEVAPNLFIHEDYRQQMFDQIRDSQLNSKTGYEYSDLGFHLFPTLIEQLTHSNYETYLYSYFFEPLGATTAFYNAYKHLPLNEIVPTELDDQFRKTLVHGYVHDEGCALMGGVSGHAGLFGSSLDLAKILQLYLQEGFYGGTRYLQAETIREFTRVQYPETRNRRALAFDKPTIGNQALPFARAYPSPLASERSYGHTGFTGTMVWVDPEHELVFVFLSNRVHPTRNNNKLQNTSLRLKLQHEIYKLHGSCTYLAHQN
jgi:beta-N-acetylhexosaminidase